MRGGAQHGRAAAVTITIASSHDTAAAASHHAPRRRDRALGPSIDRGSPQPSAAEVSAFALEQQRMRVAQAAADRSYFDGGDTAPKGAAHGLYTVEQRDQLSWLRALHRRRPELKLQWHENETVWEVIQAVSVGQPLKYVRYDLDKNAESLAAARMATSRLNATMMDASLVAEAERHGLRPRRRRWLTVSCGRRT